MGHRRHGLHLMCVTQLMMSAAECRGFPSLDFRLQNTSSGSLQPGLGAALNSQAFCYLVLVCPKFLFMLVVAGFC